MSQFFTQYFNFDVMGEHFGEVLVGFLQNLLVFAVAAVLALTWGLVLALLRQLPGKKLMPIRFVTIAYIDFFRAVPILIIILMISGGVPFLSFLPQEVRIPHWFGRPDPFWYGVTALVIVYGAFTAEVYRAGIEAVPKGQMEAARSLGFSPARAMVSIILPQALRIVLPPLTNELVLLFKDSSLVLFLGVTLDERELSKFGRDLASTTANSTPVLVAGLCYLLVTIPLSFVVRRMETRTQEAVK
jgi:polar amino acid transport system permease protein